MGLWIKYFYDGTKEIGTDYDIEEGLASWSQGELTNIKGVVLSIDFGTKIFLEVPNTEWHQFDRMSVLVTYGTTKPKRQYRVIQALIKQEHVGLPLLYHLNSSHVMVSNNTFDVRHKGFMESILPNRVGKWLSVVMQEDKKSIVVFSERGKINE